MPIFETEKFITMFKIASQWTLSKDRWIQSTSSQSISLTSILILSSYLNQNVPYCLFQVFQQNCVKIMHYSYVCYMPCPFLAPWFHFPNNIWWRVHLMKLLIMQFSSFPHYFLSLSDSKISSELLKLCHSNYPSLTKQSRNADDLSYCNITLAGFSYT